MVSNSARQIAHPHDGVAANALRRSVSLMSLPRSNKRLEKFDFSTRLTQKPNRHDHVPVCPYLEQDLRDGEECHDGQRRREHGDVAILQHYLRVVRERSAVLRKSQFRLYGLFLSSLPADVLRCPVRRPAASSASFATGDSATSVTILVGL